MARKQAEREAEIEERLRQRQSAPAEPKRGAYVPPARRQPESSEPSFSNRAPGGFGARGSSGGGAYVPPALRNRSAGAGFGDDRRDGDRRDGDRRDGDRRDGDRRPRGGFGGDRDTSGGGGGSWRRN